MRVYNVEIFERDFSLVQHYNVSDITYAFDYLSTVENLVTLPYDPAVRIGQYIRITGGALEYFGIISAVSTAAALDGYAELRYKPFLSVFDQQILFDTDLQGSVITLEQMIANQITDGWISSADSSQNIPGLEVETTSSTSGWGFHLTSDVEGMHKCVINFQTVILMRALTKYRVACVVIPDIQAQTITVSIGVPAADPVTIETDLPSVLSKNILLLETNQTVNKVVVYDKSDMVTSLTYYLHPDGSYDTTDSNRITPVKQTVKLAEAGDGETFADAAYTAAGQDLSKMEYRNLVELAVLNEDRLAADPSLVIGGEVQILSNGTPLTSILTAVEYGRTTKLTFGAIRVDLTQIIKRSTT